MPPGVQSTRRTSKACEDRITQHSFQKKKESHKNFAWRNGLLEIGNAILSFGASIAEILELRLHLHQTVAGAHLWCATVFGYRTPPKRAGGIEFFCKPFAAETGLRRVKRSTHAFVREAAGATKPNYQFQTLSCGTPFSKQKKNSRSVPCLMLHARARHVNIEAICDP